MSETPGAPEYYDPPTDAAPPSVPEPPSIHDAAGHWDAAQLQGAVNAGGAQGLAITSLVLGIVALVTGWIPVWGIVVGAAAIVLGIVAIAKRQQKGKAAAGITTGAVGAAFSVVVLVFVIIGLNSTSEYNSFGDPTAYATSVPQTTLGSEPVDGGLYVTEQAFGPIDSASGVSWFVVIIHNPNPTAYVTSPVMVTALDASGNVLDQSESYAPVPPGDTAFGSEFYGIDGGVIASLMVTTPSPQELSSDLLPTLSVSGLTATDDGFSTIISGVVDPPSTPLPYGAFVTVIARNPTGSIIGSASAIIDAPQQGQSGPFEAAFQQIMPEGTTYEGYASAF